MQNNEVSAVETGGNFYKISFDFFATSGQHHKATSRRMWNNSTRCCGNGQTGICPRIAGIRVHEISGFVLPNQLCLSLRVDPTAVCEEKKDTPMEISASSEKSSPEMRRLLGKFTEMPLLVKFFHLSTLMSLATKEAKEEFRDMLGSLPVELVR